MRLVFELLKKSVLNKSVNNAKQYFNDKECYLEISNNSIKVRDNISDDIAFILSFNSKKKVTNIITT